MMILKTGFNGEMPPSLFLKKAAGRKEVLMPRSRERTASENWSAARINEVDRWARVVWSLVQAPSGQGDAAMDAFELAPSGQGSVAFAYVRRQFEIMGSFVKNKTRLKIVHFKPEVSEEPPAIIRRLNKLHKKHAMQLNPEPQSEEMKMQKVFELPGRFKALEGKVRAIRERTTSPRVDPVAVTCDHICVDLGAQWLAWGGGRNHEN